jgi:hypothetical protein
MKLAGTTLVTVTLASWLLAAGMLIGIVSPVRAEPEPEPVAVLRQMSEYVTVATPASSRTRYGCGRLPMKPSCRMSILSRCHAGSWASTGARQRLRSERLL